MKSKLLKIKMILMDVDGVLTNGEIIYNSSGEALKIFNVYDGLGIRLAHLAGLKTGIITGRNSEAVKQRAQELQMDALAQGKLQKLDAYETIKNQFKFTDEEIAYIGDDMLDLGVLTRVGFSVAVANARDEVKAVCDYVTVQPGGQGAVREVIDKILKQRNEFYNLLAELTKK